MVRGDSYYIDVTVKNEGEWINIDLIDTVEITLNGYTKLYPGDVKYSDRLFHFPLSQEETFTLPPLCPMQVRVKFKNGNVIGSEIRNIRVKDVISQAVL